MGFKCGLVGLPNVGKSTIFNELTKLKVPAHNYPFCTIKPNIGKMIIPDSRLSDLANIVNSKHIIPTCIELVDIAGLVKGASQGEGLGNKFLSHIRQTDLIIHVVRGFENIDITHIYGKVSLIDDIEVINLELILSDLDVCKNRIRRIKSNNIFNTTEILQELEILNRCLIVLQKNEFLKILNLTIKEIKIIDHLKFITLKPIIYVINMNYNIKNDSYVKSIRSLFQHRNFIILFVYMDFMQQDSIKYNNRSFNDFQISLKKSGLDAISYLGYKLLQLKTFFTVGKQETHAWTTKSGIGIRESVRCIHTDFKKGFIRAQVIAYLDFIKYRSIENVKKLGKVKVVGKNYHINDGDIVNVLYKV
ncbi:MAG: redox-regulated ATPase YchF [Buchnera aphidicola (Nurudea yanoniella)]